jgi:hypothetical protein
MKMIAGLFKKKEQALEAFRDLQSSGFPKREMTMLIRKKVSPPKFRRRASVEEVAFSAVVGALIVGSLGVIFSLFVGVGVISFPGVMPNFEPGNARMILNLTLITFIVSVLIGIIIGAAIRLIISADRTAITDQGVKRGGLLLVVNVDRTQQATAQIVLQKNGAVDVENLTEKWNPEVWSRYKGIEVA